MPRSLCKMIPWNMGKSIRTFLNIFYSGKGKKLCIESHELILTFFLLSWAHMVYEGPRRKRSHADGSTVASPLLLECRNTVQFTFAHLIYAYGFMQCIV